MLTASRVQRSAIIAVALTITIVLIASGTGPTAEDEPEWPIDYSYQVDVLRPDGSLAYVEHHDLHARGPTDWFDVITGYEEGDACAEYFPAQVGPDVEVEEDPYCEPEYRVGELRRWDGTDALQIGFLTPDQLVGDDGFVPSDVLDRWRSTADTASFVPLPAGERASFGPSPALLSPTYLSQAAEPATRDDGEPEGAAGAEAPLASSTLEHVVVEGPLDAHLALHADYGFPIVGVLVDPGTGATLRLTVTDVATGSRARDVTAP